MTNPLPDTAITDERVEYALTDEQLKELERRYHAYAVAVNRPGNGEKEWTDLTMGMLGALPALLREIWRGRFALTAAAQAKGREGFQSWVRGQHVGELCTHGVKEQRTPIWIIKFEDASRGEAYFDNEPEAIDFYLHASNSWNCSLLTTVRIAAAQVGKDSPTAAAMRAFGASHIACFKWPDDTPEHRLARAAYCEGAFDAALIELSMKRAELARSGEGD